MDPIMWGPIALWTAIPLAALITGGAILLRIRRPPATTDGLTRAERWITSAIGTAAILTVILSALALVVGAVTTFGEGSKRILDMPVSAVTRPAFLDGVAEVTDARYTAAFIEVSGLPAGSLWLLYLEQVLPSFTTVAIAVAVAWIALALLTGRPFTKSLPAAISIAGLAVMVGGLGTQIAAAFARASVVEFLGARDVTAGSDGSGPHDGFALLSLSLDLAPVGWAFGLLMVAAAFQIGTRLQHETDLLV
ncbi:hypothetical protein LG299_12240 [Microbacterium lacus]|uniref:hypothetical protein n=1 Tax=Microbacterium lacus TaxID=415217 RepID=UPI00384B417B